MPAVGRPRIVVLGRQGSGKGTQAARLSAMYGVPHVSTGDAFRSAVKAGAQLGRRVQGYLERGELVPDEMVLAVIKEHLFGSEAPGGFILDGFPRTVAQAEALADLAAPRGIDVVLDLEVGNEEAVRRISGRRVCANCGTTYNLVYKPPKISGICDVCGGGPLVQRDDDTEDAVRRRLELYETMTAPLIDWYSRRDLLSAVAATGTPDEVTDRATTAIGARLGG